MRLFLIGLGWWIAASCTLGAVWIVVNLSVDWVLTWRDRRQAQPGERLARLRNLEKLK